MRKAILKRIRFTKRGKLLHRGAGINHFNAKSSRRAQMRQKHMRGFASALAKKFRTTL